MICCFWLSSIRLFAIPDKFRQRFTWDKSQQHPVSSSDIPTENLNPIVFSLCHPDLSFIMYFILNFFYANYIPLTTKKFDYLPISISFIEN